MSADAVYINCKWGWHVRGRGEHRSSPDIGLSRGLWRWRHVSIHRTISRRQKLSRGIISIWWPLDPHRPRAVTDCPHVIISISVNRRRWASVGLILGQRLRRWTNIKPTLVQCLVFAGISRVRSPRQSCQPRFRRHLVSYDHDRIGLCDHSEPILQQLWVHNILYTCVYSLRLTLSCVLQCF